MKLLDAIARAKAERDFGHIVAAIPYMQFLGLQSRDGEGGIVCVLPQDPKLIGNPLLPALHGGVVGALLESAAILQLIWAAETVQVPKTIDLSVDYLRPAKPVETLAQGIITKRGRRIANVRMEAWQDDRARPVATGHAHFLLA